MRSVKCEVWSEECEVVKCKVWGVECGVRSLKWKLWSAESKL